MKKLHAILGLAALMGGLMLSSPAVAYQASSTATQATPAATPMTPAEKKAARAEKRAAKAAAEKNAGPASAPAATPAAPASAAAPVSAKAPSTTSAPATAKAPKSTTAKPVTPTATPGQIADAKSKGLVWVNESSKVYHKSGDRYYGATKTGEFMTEADAQKAGAHLAK